MDTVKTLLNAEFLNEPAFKWFLFLGFILLSLAGWRKVMDYM